MRLQMRLILLTIAFALAGCGQLPSYRYKMTVEVETPEGLRTGSSVIEVRARRSPKLLPDMVSISMTATGEAVAVDLPNGRKLFALLHGQGATAEDFALAAVVHPEEHSSGDYDKVAERLSQSRRRGALPLERYPILVTFDDPRNPSSIKAVDPSNLAEAFGDGNTLKRIIIETTREPVTDKIVSILPWLPTDQRAIVLTLPSGVKNFLGTDREAFQNLE